jgi:hypothetical protein
MKNHNGKEYIINESSSKESLKDSKVNHSFCWERILTIRLDIVGIAKDFNFNSAL